MPTPSDVERLAPASAARTTSANRAAEWPMPTSLPRAFAQADQRRRARQLGGEGEGDHRAAQPRLEPLDERRDQGARMHSGGWCPA